MMPNPPTADLATAVKQARAAMTTRLSTAICKLQQQTTQDREAKGPMWVSRVVFPAPREDDACQTVCDVITILGRGMSITYARQLMTFERSESDIGLECPMLSLSQSCLKQRNFAA